MVLHCNTLQTIEKSESWVQNKESLSRTKVKNVFRRMKLKIKKMFVSTNVESKARSLAWIMFLVDWWFRIGGLYQPLIND
jgi:hypothetical protein